MKTSIQEIDGKLVAFLSGELDTAAAAEVEADLRPLLGSEGRDVVIDCSSNTSRPAAFAYFWAYSRRLRPMGAAWCLKTSTR